MKWWAACCLAVVLPLNSPPDVRAQEEGLREWLQRIDEGLTRIERHAGAGEVDAARAVGIRVYLDQYELIEGWYGPGGAHGAADLAAAVMAAERGFHVLMRSNSAGEMERTARQLRTELRDLERLALSTSVPLYPRAETAVVASGEAAPSRFQSSEVRRLATMLDAAEASFLAGDRTAALRQVEEAYLEVFEPLEARLAGAVVSGVEQSIHLRLRPALRGRAPAPEIRAHFAELRSQLGRADRALASGSSFLFGAFNSFVIILREGLEAVLLLAAMLAYLNAAQAGRTVRLRIWAGAGAGILASVVTWILAITLVPVSGASRELVEGITALLAVSVLLYVSHWLFQKTYIHDWKQYLREHLGTAVSRGSALAMMGLAFAAVYREGFETVLFYQALLLDAGGSAVLAGFVPGLLVISLVGWGVIQAGLRLPLKQVFAVTNSILLYLAFVFLGKGVYNLQESGAFAAHPLEWLPANPWLQQVFGFYPLAETVFAQCALAVVLVGVLIVYRRQVLQLRRLSVATPTA